MKFSSITKLINRPGSCIRKIGRRDGQFVKQFMKINIIVFQTHDPIMFVMQPKLGYIMGAHIVNIVLSVDNNILLHCNFKTVQQSCSMWAKP